VFRQLVDEDLVNHELWQELPPSCEKRTSGQIWGVERPFKGTALVSGPTRV